MTISQTQFLYLLRTGLWGKMDDPGVCEEADLLEIIRIARSQTVFGLVIDGLDSAMKSCAEDLQLPENYARKLMLELLLIENTNRHLNAFMPKLSKMLTGIDYVMVKGQAVAQYYRNPLHRQAGDIDLVLDVDNYRQAADSITKKADKIEKEDIERRHFSSQFGDICLELHGAEVYGYNKNLDARIIEWTFRRLSEQKNEVEYNGVKINIPSENFDAIYIFLHFFKHFINSGISFRQLCDWVRCLNSGKVDMDILKEDIEYLGCKEVWKVFACVGVKYLGCPKSVMPYYDSKYEEKAAKVVKIIFKGGNFGYEDYRKLHFDNFLFHKVYGMITIIRHGFKIGAVFPRVAFNSTTYFIVRGIKHAFKEIFN